jgi:uncharacterized membrane protein YczE
MSKLLQRNLIFLSGLFINSFGIAFITKSNLGTSPISSVPYVYSLYFTNLTFGMTTFILNMIFILIQKVLLKDNFKPAQYLQIVVNFIFSSFIDLSMYLLARMQPVSLWARLLSLLVGCVVLAAGICTEVAPDVLLVPGEGIVRAIAIVTKREFGKIKVLFDVTLMVLAVISSFIFFHGLNGLGFGTLCSAVLVGRFVSFLTPRLPSVRYARKLLEK